VIVRISSEAQYRLDDAHHAKLDELDDAVVEAVDADDRAGFVERFDALLDFVRAQGEPLGEEDLEPSDVILPPSDLSFEEAGQDFSGEGLVPDPA
jgi:hypothetical protein